MYAGLAIYDTMQFIKPDVQTICVGIAMSMGALLLSGGAEGKRMALPNAKILIHQVSSSFQGQATDIEIHAKEIIDVRQRLDEILAKHTGQDLEKVAKDTERDYFMSAEEAKEYRLIDRVIASTSPCGPSDRLERTAPLQLLRQVAAAGQEADRRAPASTSATSASISVTRSSTRSSPAPPPSISRTCPSRRRSTRSCRST